MKRTAFASLTLASAILTITPRLLAQDAAQAAAQGAAPATSPATTTATTTASAPAALQAVISAVEGVVQVRLDEKSPWQAAQAGMALGEGAEFRTGPRSAVQFEIPPGQVITLDRLGQCKLLEAISTAKSVKTDLGMKYGRVRYDIEAAGVAHDATVHSPSAALAVRGTQFSLEDQPPFKPQAVSLTGRVQFRNQRRAVTFGGAGKGKTTMTGDTASPAQTALLTSQLLHPGLQRTDQQVRELNYLFNQQGTSFLGNVVTSTTPITDAQLPNLFSGRLNFVLRWDYPQAADLNIVVGTPLDEQFGNPPFIFSFFPGNPQVAEFLRDTLPQSSPSGGRVGLNHIGPAGIEIASFDANFPRGNYVVSAYNFLFNPDFTPPPDAPRVPFTIEAFLDGQRQELILNLAAALAGTEPPRCGFVFRDDIALGEISFTALPIPQDGDLCNTGSRAATAAAPAPVKIVPYKAKSAAKPLGKPITKPARDRATGKRR